MVYGKYIKSCVNSSILYLGEKAASLSELGQTVLVRLVPGVSETLSHGTDGDQLFFEEPVSNCGESVTVPYIVVSGMILTCRGVFIGISLWLCTYGTLGAVFTRWPESFLLTSVSGAEYPRGTDMCGYPPAAAK